MRKPLIAVTFALWMVLVGSFPLISSAQEVCQAPNALNISLEPRALFTRSQVSMGELWNGTQDRTAPEILVSGPLVRDWQLAYSFRPGWNQDDIVMPGNSFIVGGVEFGSAATEQRKPVSLQWHHRASHRVEVRGLTTSPVQPLVVGQWIGSDVEATCNRDDTILHATNSWRLFLWGIGGSCRVQKDRVTWDVSACVGDRLRRVEGNVSWIVSPGLWLTGGYAWERWTVNDLTVDQRNPFVGVKGAW